MSIVVRKLTEADLDPAFEVLQAAFDRRGVFDRLLAIHRQAEPELMWVAEEAGHVVGTVTAIDYGPVAYIGMMSVDPKRQRRGIASKLMERSLAALKERGCTVVLLDASDSGAPLYEGLGFVDDSIAQFFERVATLPLESPSSDVRISLASSVAELVAFDTPVFGGCRQKLFEVLWPEQQGRCLVARDRNGAMLGYLMARDPTLGPWAALHEEAAEALLRAALELPFEHMPHVYLPRSNEQSAALLRRYGFVARRSLRHMRLGGTCPPGQPDKLYGQSSFGHG